MNNNKQKAMTPNEIAKKVTIKLGTVFPSVEESRQALRSVGISRDIASYLWAKTIFGHSRLFGAYCDFWVGGLKSADGIESLSDLNKWWQDNVSFLQGSCESLMGKSDSAEDRAVASMAGNWKHLRPFCLLGEYRSIFAWDLTRPNGAEEFEIVKLDYQLYNVGYYPDLYSIFENIVAGHFDDEMKRDEHGNAVFDQY